MAFFPIFIDLSQKQVLVVGAGRVGSRRINVLSDFGAAVTVVDKAPSPQIRKLAEEKKIKLVCSDYRAFRENGDVDFFMVLAATGDKTVDDMVSADASKMKAFFNLAGAKECSDFYFPGIVTGEQLTAGVIAGGDDHGLAKRAAGQIRKLVEEIETKENAGE